MMPQACFLLSRIPGICAAGTALKRRNAHSKPVLPHHDPPVHAYTYTICAKRYETDLMSRFNKMFSVRQYLLRAKASCHFRPLVSIDGGYGKTRKYLPCVQITCSKARSDKLAKGALQGQLSCIYLSYIPDTAPSFSPDYAIFHGMRP
ncbi:hypothetical protein F5Y14DRAFT_86237 [Nemania sp. NC0429]|nr:hypothetical protein F5Y14DRAFT_86237 [Nemania sp. NC0429]